MQLWLATEIFNHLITEIFWPYIFEKLAWTKVISEKYTISITGLYFSDTHLTEIRALLRHGEVSLLIGAAEEAGIAHKLSMLEKYEQKLTFVAINLP